MDIVFFCAMCRMFGIVPGQNPFLDQFLKRRKEVAAKAAIVTEAAAPAKKLTGASSITALPTHDMDLATICESKPKQKVVREYFQQRVEELVSEM